MNVIDFRIPSTDAPFPQEYIKNCWVRVLRMGYHSWLEAPVGEAECTGLDPITDPTDQINWRGVHGYISFGFVDGVETYHLSPGGIPNSMKVRAQDHVMWLPQQFINWRENYFEPQPPNDISERMHRPNAVRIWLRKDVRAFVHFNIAEFDPRVASAQIRDPITGNLLFDPKNPPNLVNPF